MSKIFETTRASFDTLAHIGRAVRTRRKELGLSQNQLARLSGPSRHTVVGLENGSLEDLGVNRVSPVIIVLSPEAAPRITQVRSKKRGLWMAAKTASVSYAS